MQKKIIIGLLVFLVFVGMGVGAWFLFREQPDQFVLEYEGMNHQKNASGKEYRTVSISREHPFVYIEPEELVKKIENKETFYVYFGSKLCPWCRSVIEKAIEVAKKNNIKEIYYIDIWDENGKEILRDQYVLNEDELEKTIEGTKEYQIFLKSFDTVLKSYTFTKEDGTIVDTKEKRIFAPYFIYVQDGKAVRATSGTSTLQTDSRMELTKEILEDEEKLFQDFFQNDVCEKDLC